jgi:thiamine transporter ThiT
MSNLSPSFLGFLRGVAYPLIGGAIYGLCQYLLHSPYLSVPVALVLTGWIAQIEHKYNIPVYPSSSATPTASQ